MQVHDIQFFTVFTGANAFEPVRMIAHVYFFFGGGQVIYRIVQYVLSQNMQRLALHYTALDGQDCT